jgi:tight adherence protein B
MPDPIGGEFKRVYDSMSYGLDLKDALDQMAGRLRVGEVHYMIAAIRIQYATGGNLSEVLATLASVIRERVRLKGKVKALSAESRLSGNIMSFMPFLVVAGLNFIRPDFYDDVPHNVTLQYIMAGALCLVFIGIVLIRRIVNIRM